MLVCRRLLIAAALVAFSEDPASSDTFSKISELPEFSGYSGFRVYARSANSSSVTFTSTASSTGCRLSEFLCNTGYCISQDKYCDGENDCGDKSDEPKYCTREYPQNEYITSCSAKFSIHQASFIFLKYD